MITSFNKQRRHRPSQWSLEKLRIGLEKYKEIYHKYPSTLDFDKVDFLPSSRLIQRNYGGIVRLKEELELDCVTDYTRGEYRSKVARKTWNDAIDYECDFYNFLIAKIPEIQVHEHKILRPGHICCDFFIYTSNNGGFAIDIFYAQDLFSLSRVLNIKHKRYCELKILVYFVLVGNESIKQDEIDKIVNNCK